MSKNWDFYYSRVDDRPASIFFDVDITKEIDLNIFPYMAYVRLYLLKSNDEYDALCNIEDNIESKLTINNDTVYVGRNTSDGCRDFYFYTAEPMTWASKVKLVMNEFSDTVN